MKPNTVFKRAYNRGLSRLSEFAVAADIGPEPSWAEAPLVTPASKTRIGVAHRFAGPAPYWGGRCPDVDRSRVLFADARCALQARLTDAAFRLSSASI